MKLTYNATGGVMKVGDKVAERLLKSGLWSKVEANKDETSVSEQSDDSDTGSVADVLTAKAVEDNKDDKPDVAVVRKWAQENGVEVSSKGRVADQVYDKYAEAHKE